MFYLTLNLLVPLRCIIKVGVTLELYAKLYLNLDVTQKLKVRPTTLNK